MTVRLSLLLLLLLAVGCAHYPKHVNCDGHLEPINPPNPVVKDAPGHGPS